MLNEPTPKVSLEPDATGWKDKEATTAARIDDLLAIDGPDVRQHAIYEFLRDLSFDDLLEIFTSREQLPSGPRAERLLKTVWRRLGELDGERALHQLMLVVSSRKERRDLPRHTEAAVASWAFAAPVEALFYLNEGLEGNDPFARNHITTWQRSLMAEGRYEVVSRLIPEIRTDLHRRQAIRMLVSEWIKFDPDRVGEWLNELPDGNARSDGLEIYVRNWAKSDPGSAAEWAQNLDLDERERFMSVVAGQWVGSGDQMEFVDWLAAQPRSPNRDQLIYDLGLRLGAELGQSLAQSISDPEFRLEYEQKLSQKTIVNNLRRIASAAQQRMLDKGEPQIRYSQIVGDENYLTSVPSISGESYEQIDIRTNTTRISVTTREGKKVHYDF